MMQAFYLHGEHGELSRVTFLSGAKSAIKACLLLPKMLSDFLKACTDITESHAHCQMIVTKL